jgi:ArsR family transcriptional regulator
MHDTLKLLRALADSTRLRIMTLLEQAELSVHELQQITDLGQSRISTHLGLMHEAGLLESRREGKRTFYKLNSEADAGTRQFVKLTVQGAESIPEYAQDQLNLKRVLARREEQEKTYFDQVAGRFDRSYGPGRSWQAFGQLLLRMLPPVVVADLGSGEGLLSELLARRAKQVIAIDNSARMVAFGQRKAAKIGLKNLEFRLGDLEDPPIEPETIDFVILSQALHHANDPGKAVRSAHRILRRGGRILILDLRSHNFKQAEELYGDRWLGFTENQLQEWLESAGFGDVEVGVVAREAAPPNFETLLAEGAK